MVEQGPGLIEGKEAKKEWIRLEGIIKDALPTEETKNWLRN